jgi:hypothetical protein
LSPEPHFILCLTRSFIQSPNFLFKSVIFVCNSANWDKRERERKKERDRERERERQREIERKRKAERDREKEKGRER